MLLTLPQDTLLLIVGFEACVLPLCHTCIQFRDVIAEVLSPMNLDNVRHTLPLIQWFTTQGLPLNQRLMNSAAKEGELDIMQWLQSQGVPVTLAMMQAAAYKGHLEVVKWIHALRSDWAAWGMLYAAKAGHLDVLQFLYESRGQRLPQSCMFFTSASRGGPRIMQWLKAETDREYLCYGNR